MSQSVKVYYVENRATKEIRKFTLEQDVVGNFEYLAAKIRRVFPDLLRKDIDVFWKDEEEEFVTISSDDELYQALEFAQSENESSGLLKLYIKIKPQNETIKDENKKQKEHPGITCDGCDSTVRGIRFKCTQCHDFDLCSDCNDKDIHPSDHEMVCIKLPRTYGHFMRNPAFARGMRSGPFGRGGPFRRQCGNGKRFPFGGMFHPFGYPPHGFPIHREFTSQCPAATPESSGSGEEKGSNDQQKQDSNKFTPECIRIFASTLGLDPDVASNYFEVYFGGHPEKNVENSEKKEGEETQEKQVDDKESSSENDVDFHKEDNENNQQEGMNTEESMEDVASSIETPPVETENNEKQEEKPELQNELEEMVGVFAKQFGLTPEAQKNITGGLDSLLQGMFNQSVPQTDNSENKEQSLTGTSIEPNTPEEFVLVDQGKEGEKSPTEEEKYQRRLDKALKQMEAMGFDNDGGWLKQLLVSKDLSIGRVLDSLNPSF